MSKSRVVVAQPQLEVWDFENNWDKGLSECCFNMGDCCYAFFCPMCYVCILYMYSLTIGQSNKIIYMYVCMYFYFYLKARRVIQANE